MKRIAALLMVLAILLPCAGVASGLSGLTGGGLSGLLTQEVTGDADVVPDPAELLGKSGSVLQKDYAVTADYICTAYTYPLATDVNAFVAEYAAEAKKNGFTAEQTSMDGFDGWAYTASNGKQAMLFPQFEGVTLLLVENDMQFGKPARTDYYISFKRNGYEIEGTWDDNEAGATEERRSNGTSTSFEIFSMLKRAPIGNISIGFPNYVREGDVFHATRGNLINGVSFYTDKDGLLVYHDVAVDCAIESGSDYLTIEIGSMEEVKQGIVFEGTFEASFNHGDLMFTDGEFRVLCKD